MNSGSILLRGIMWKNQGSSGITIDKHNSAIGFMVHTPRIALDGIVHQGEYTYRKHSPYLGLMLHAPKTEPVPLLERLKEQRQKALYESSANDSETERDCEDDIDYVMVGESLLHASLDSTKVDTDYVVIESLCSNTSSSSASCT